jgi:ATP-dependent helicase/nuclease subunit B
LNGDPGLHLLPFEDDPLEYLAGLILDRHGDQLPDLGAHTVLLPSQGAGHRFRRILLEAASARGTDALIPPAIENLQNYISRSDDPSHTSLSQTGRELILMQALEDLPGLRSQYGTWPLIDSLLPLFDELTLNQVPIAESQEEFTSDVVKAYGGSAPVPELLSQEAALVYRLWQAWQEELQNRNTRDRSGAYVDALTRSLGGNVPDGQIYVAGLLRLARAELAWLNALVQAGRADIVVQESQDRSRSPAPDLMHALEESVGTAEARRTFTATPRGEFLDRVYGPPEPDLASRARSQRESSTNSPLAEHMEICALEDGEHEARAIDLQVRRWLLEGTRNIGIVTNDRKLARRVRALLERAEIELKDSAGWTLSTTSAAAALIQWLDCIEQDFQRETLFSFLRSPYQGLPLGDDPDSLLHYLLGVLVKRERVYRGLESYRRALERAPNEDEVSREAGLVLLGRLTEASSGLASLAQGGRSTARQCFAALESGLEITGLYSTLDQDEAGRSVLEAISGLRGALEAGSLRLDWQEFRGWIQRQLEAALFRPPMRGAGVELMGLAESRLYRFDALVIAGAVRDHLPGTFSDSPFFNETVRQQLGLASLRLRQQERLHDFRRLLEAAPLILITYARQQQGDDAEVSPWVERLQAFQRAAYDTMLDAGDLESLVYEPAAQIHRDEALLPGVQKQAAVTMAADLVPRTYSASACQSLVDCPYQFFARYGLGLRAEELPGEAMEKSEYGNRVHRILEAFHGGVESLPGPFSKSLTPENLAEATELLEEISQSVFFRDLERNPVNRAWHYRWRQTIPHYLEWVQKHSQSWSAVQTEIDLQRQLTPELSLFGRIDRLERGPRGLGILDYKTGLGAHQNEALSGESVQLATYALLPEDPVSAATTLILDSRNVRTGIFLEGKELETISVNQRERLLSLHARLLEEGARLHAWGDDNTCRYCDLSGLCRKGLSEEADHVRKTG